MVGRQKKYELFIKDGSRLYYHFTSMRKTKGSFATVHFCGGWLDGLGFIPYSLVKVLPVKDCFDFHLCNENITSYSELAKEVDLLGGRLVTAFTATHKGGQYTTLSTCGGYLRNSGLSLHDPLVAKCEPGIIRVRRLDYVKMGVNNVRYLFVGNIKDKSGRSSGLLSLQGKWLPDSGFGAGATVSLGAEPGVITLRLTDPSEDYAALVRRVRENKWQLRHVKSENRTPYIKLRGGFIDKAGFLEGDLLEISYGYGLIKIRIADFTKLGL